MNYIYFVISQSDYLLYYNQSRKLSMLFKLIASVDALCKSADVVGASSPVTPHNINPELNPTIVL